MFEKKVGTERLGGLTDGIFAIAITLLMLDFTSIDASIPLSELLNETLPKFAGWAISFFVIATFWIQNHTIVQKMEYVDIGFLWINILFIMSISLMPWLTSLLHTYKHEPRIVMMFSANTGFAGIIAMIQWQYAVHRKLLFSDIDPKIIKMNTILNISTPIFALISFVFIVAGHHYMALYCWIVNVLLRLAVSLFDFEKMRKAL